MMVTKGDQENIWQTIKNPPLNQRRNKLSYLAMDWKQCCHNDQDA